MTPTSLVKKVNPLSELHLNLDFGEVGPLFSPDVGARCASPQTLTTYVWTPPSLLSASAPAAANALMVPTTTRGLPGLVCRAQMHFHCCVPAYCHNLFIYSPAARGLITLLLCAVMFPHTCHGVYGQHFPWSRYAEVEYPSRAHVHTANIFSPTISSPSHLQSRQDSCPPQSSELPDSDCFH